MTTGRTTPKDFALFKDACEIWQDVLGLADWEFRFQHLPVDTALACVHLNVENRLASFVFAKVWGTDTITPAAVKAVAKHEVLHVLLADLADLSTRRITTDAIVSEVEHAIIRRLEKVL